MSWNPAGGGRTGRMCSCRITSVALIGLPAHLCGSLRRSLCCSLCPGVCFVPPSPRLLWLFCLLLIVCCLIFCHRFLTVILELLSVDPMWCIQCAQLLEHVCSCIYHRLPCAVFLPSDHSHSFSLGQGKQRFVQTWLEREPLSRANTLVPSLKGLLIRFWESGKRTYWFSITCNMNH